ncbi:MAG: aspartate carbamoyltransferase, partial [Ruminiclostridium sp.]|nr:aspartate carbamoyltransferase [Ruminiclostridium sp.]
VLSVLYENINAKPLVSGKEYPNISCHNPKCISNHESSLPHLFREHNGALECEYCDEKQALK